MVQPSLSRTSFAFAVQHAQGRMGIGRDPQRATAPGELGFGGGGLGQSAASQPDISQLVFERHRAAAEGGFEESPDLFGLHLLVLSGAFVFGFAAAEVDLPVARDGASEQVSAGVFQLQHSVGDGEPGLKG